MYTGLWHVNADYSLHQMVEGGLHPDCRAIQGRVVIRLKAKCRKQMNLFTTTEFFLPTQQIGGWMALSTLLQCNISKATKATWKISNKFVYYHTLPSYFNEYYCLCIMLLVPVCILGLQRSTCLVSRVSLPLPHNIRFSKSIKRSKHDF